VDEVVVVPDWRDAPALLLEHAQLTHDADFEPRLLVKFADRRPGDRLARLDPSARHDRREFRLVEDVEDKQL